MLEIQIITPNVSIRIVQKYELNIMFNTRLKMEKNSTKVTYFQKGFFPFFLAFLNYTFFDFQPTDTCVMIINRKIKMLEQQIIAPKINIKIVQKYKLVYITVRAKNGKNSATQRNIFSRNVNFLAFLRKKPCNLWHFFVFQPIRP